MGDTGRVAPLPGRSESTGVVVLVNSMFAAERRRRLASRNESTRTKSLYLDNEPARLPPLAWPVAVVSGLAILLVTALLGAGGEPFPFSAGQIAAQDYRLSVELSLKNEIKTRKEQEESALLSRLAFD